MILPVCGEHVDYRGEHADYLILGYPIEEYSPSGLAVGATQRQHHAW